VRWNCSGAPARAAVRAGDTVNIVGGGNVAYDCARTLLRMGRKVNIVCLEKGADMLADREEIEEASEEGAVLYDGAASISFELRDGHIVGHRIADVDTFRFDDSPVWLWKPWKAPSG
jgi:NADPH-dependent glutamate synthase beta subunit-like oxidoreductase